MYHEARGEGPVGMVAVGQTTLNRAEAGDKRWPSDVCKVVQQMRRSQCQFSWYCDGITNKPEDKDAWNLSRDLAIGIIGGNLRNPLLEKATCYHATWISPPKWTAKAKFVAKIGEHRFYDC